MSKSTTELESNSLGNVPVFCRLCLAKLCGGNGVGLINVNKEFVETVLPELDFNLTKDPVLCSTCIDCLKLCYNFKIKCLENEKKIKNYYYEKYFKKMDLYDVMQSMESSSCRNIDILAREYTFKSSSFEANSDVEIVSDVISSVEDTVDVKAERDYEEGISIEQVVLNWFPVLEPSSESSHQTKSSENSQFANSESGDEDGDSRLCEVDSPVTNKYVSTRKVVSTQGCQKYKCKFCEKRFSQKLHMDGHLINKHGDQSDIEYLITNKIHYCSYCNYRTINSFNLSRHIVVKHKKKDDNLKVLNCLHCDYKTSNKGNLIIHLRRHTKDRPFICCYCQKAYSQKSNMHMHILKHHSGEGHDVKKVITSKIHSCYMCSFQTMEKHKLEKHITKHTKNFPMDFGHR